MGIKPALGWLGLLLFATAAQAEPSTMRWARAALVERQKPEPAPTVTPRTKAPPKATLAVVEAITTARADYEADGRVLMVFERQRREAFRIPKASIRGIVRLAGAADQLDVVETTNGTVVVDKTAHGSDVYALGREGTPELEALPARARDRVREALAVAAKY